MIRIIRHLADTTDNTGNTDTRTVAQVATQAEANEIRHGLRADARTGTDRDDPTRDASSDWFTFA
jgi:hypothetical protein